MGRSRVGTNTVLFGITVFLGIVVVGFRIFLGNLSANRPMKPVLAIIDERMDPSWTEANAGPALGTRVPPMPGVFINGAGGNLDYGGGGRRKVLFLMPDPDVCPDCHATARNLAEYWNRQYVDKLAIHLLYKGLAPAIPDLPAEGRSDSRPIAVGGVEPFMEALVSTGSRVFFVSETGRVIYFMPMPNESRWLVCDEAVRSFALTGTLPKSLSPSEWVKVGKPLPGMDLKRLDGSIFQLAMEAKGTISVLFHSSIGCKPCETLYPVVQSIHESFGNRINLYLIYSDPAGSEIAAKEIHQFNALIGLSVVKADERIKNDYERELGQMRRNAERSHAECLVASPGDITDSWASPSCVIIDRDGNVVAKYVLASGIGNECRHAEPEICTLIRNLLE